MSEKLQLGGILPDAGDVGVQFEQIVQGGLDPNYIDGPAPEDPVVPFGQFTEGDKVDERIAPMATATGYTGNNAEEGAN